ncbi:MAG: lactate utilization protein [Planctomycetes bacterium]|nr:lactate utilization protein [Planctomycetota bacterium]
MTTREDFLQRVRQAATADRRPGSSPPLPTRGQVGYQGAGADLVARFRDEFLAAGGYPYLVPDHEAAVARLLDLVKSRSPRRVLLGHGTFLDALVLGERLRPLGVEITAVDTGTPQTNREAFFEAELGISGVDFLVAETGSLVLLARPEEPRSLSLLPPVHIALAERRQLLPDLFDLFDMLANQEKQEDVPLLPSCVSLITGPSKTGDIELRLVTGVHGPGELHLILVNE